MQSYSPSEGIKAAAMPPLADTAFAARYQAHQNNSARMQRLVEILPAGVVVLDGQGRVQEANRVAIEMLDEPLVGEPWRDVIARAFRPQADDGHEVSLANGRRVKLATTALEPEPGQLILLTDLTETRQLQGRLAHLQRLSSLGKMVATLAHQVRTPLSAAMLYASNLSNQTLSAQARANFQNKLISRLKDLEHQVNDMLMFARSDSQVEANPISLQGLLNEVQAGVDAMVNQHDSQLTVILPEPDVLLTGNQRTLASAICNLIHNSLQACGRGAALCLSAERCGADRVAISVIDDGPGIPDELRQKVLEPFFTTRSQGTGLGLAVVQAVAKQHGGQIEIGAVMPKGTRVSIVLPRMADMAEHQRAFGG